MKSIWNSFMDWLYPRRCVFCGKIMDCGENGECCPVCLKNLFFLEEPLWTMDMGAAEHVYSAIYYEEPMPNGIYHFKFRNKSHLCKPFAAMILDRMKDALLAERCEIVTAVPMHPYRRRRRGYNQAELLGRELAKGLELPYENCLRRVKLTRIQHRVERSERKLAQRGSFASRPLHGEKVLLVDDIVTSGSTLKECARVLMESGASSVTAVTLCRASLRKRETPDGVYLGNKNE